ncbi:MAG: autotransporter-associated beta strand repeat-containing protein, partial [Opitutales bacterium]|nr:autotransporter-associated beta strand repeat-containing protein [Opitutales bacterium]
MKIRTTKYAAILGTAITLAVPGLINAQTTYTWDGGGDAITFSDGLNWTGVPDNTAPTDDTTTDIAQLIGGTINLTANRSAYGLDLITAATTLTGPATTFTVGGDDLGGGLTGDQALTLNDTNTLSLLGGNGDGVTYKYSQNYTGDITVGAGSSILSQRFGLRLDTATHGNTTITLDGGKIKATNDHLEVNGRAIVLTANGGTLEHQHARNIYGFSDGTGTIISGPGQLTLVGQNTTAGRIQLGSTNTYTGGTRIENGGQAWIYSDASLGDTTTGVTLTTGGTMIYLNNMTTTRAITLEGDGRIAANGKTIAYNGGVDAITGTGSLYIVGSGTTPGSANELRWEGTSGNTYSGGTTLDAVGIRTSAGTLGTGDITLMNGGYIKNKDNNFTVPNNIIVDATGGGIESGWTNRRITVNGLISGEGELTIRNDSSEVYLNNAGNTYAGGTKILAKLAAENAGSLGTGPLTFDGGFIRNNNSNIELGTRDVIIEAGGAEIQVGWSNRRIRMDGIVSGPGAITVMDDSSSLILTNANTYSGGTEIRGFVLADSGGLGTGDITLTSITAGRGQLKNNGGATTLTNNLTIDPDNGGRMLAGWDSELRITGVVSGVFNDLDLAHALTIGGDSGWVALDNPANTFGAKIALPDATSKIRVASLGNGTVSGDYDGETSGLGEIDFAIGTGTQAISYPLGHTGGTTISSGTLNLKYDGAFISDVSLLPDTGVLKLGGGTLDLLNGTHAEVVASTTLLAGTASGVTQTGGTATLQMGAITRESGASIDFGASNIATTTNTNTNGILGSWATIAGTDFATVDDSGNIIAFAAYSDVTRTDSGTQVIADGATSQVRIVEGTGTPADITLGAALTTIDTLNQSTDGGTSAATIDLSAGALAVNSILIGTGAGDLTFNNGTLQSADTSLIVTHDAAVTVNSVIADGTGASDLSQSGTGALTINGNSTYTGNTVVNGGTVTINGTSAYAGNTVVNAGSLKITNSVASDNFEVSSGSTLEIDTTTGGDQILGTGTISGSGTFIKSGSNTMKLGANGQVQNISMSAGALIDVQGGTLQNDFANGNWTNNYASLNVEAGATVDTWDSAGGIRVDQLTGAGTITHTSFGAPNNLTVGVNGGTSSFDGLLTDDGARLLGLVKEGAGTQTLTGANTHTGLTKVSNGTLVISNDLGLQNSAIDTSGAGQITLVGTTPTFGGLVSNGDLTSVISNYATVTALTLSPVAGASHTYSGDVLDSIAPMPLIKSGDGTQILSGNVTYTGTTTVNGGTLAIQGDFASIDLATAAGGTLEIDTTAGDQQINGGTISGDGTFVKSGPGLLMLGANGSAQLISMTGGLIDVQEGTLRNEYGKGDWSANLSSLNIEAGAIVDTWDGGNIRVDALTGAGTVTHTSYGTPTTITVGVNDGSGTFSGVLTDDVSRVLGLVKEGAGTQTLSGAHTHTGATTVSAGTLELAAGSLTSPITVSSVASLGFVIDSSITSTASVDFVAGSTVSISGTPTLASYTLITASSITGTAVLASPITDYELVQDGTTLTLVSTVAPSDPYDVWSGGATFDVDTNGDGVDNGLAFILGAADENADALSLLPDGAATGGDLVL